jgi:hypothetical protein
MKFTIAFLLVAATIASAAPLPQIVCGGKSTLSPIEL